ncbi:MAG: iron chelate uptake ABC transporter family permease subunit [Candidatus Bathyarchaeota archaeon]|nr:iron chelate uptake ABC transporter family permease subunit [Candidatus Bathyarchaeum sp.]
MKQDAETSHLKHVSHWKLYLVILLILFGIVFVLSLNLGYAHIPFSDILKILSKQVPFLNDLVDSSGISNTSEVIITQLRLPRVICGALVGASLATAGVIYQGIFRNPMADPYVIGSMSGASLGAALVLVLGVGVSFLGVNTLQIFAFVCSFATVLAVYSISKTGSRVPVTMLLLTGIAITYFQSAIVTFLQTVATDKVHRGLAFWLIGSLSSTETWSDVWSVFPFLVLGFVAAYLYSRDLNVLALGEDQAQHLGVEIEKLKRILLICATLMTAAAVSISGLIGFVGLIIPHLTRLIVGPDHRILLPTSAVVGASFLMISDSIARVIMGSGEAPVGVITALAGGPFFIYLLRRKKRGYTM